MSYLYVAPVTFFVIVWVWEMILIVNIMGRTVPILCGEQDYIVVKSFSPVLLKSGEYLYICIYLYVCIYFWWLMSYILGEFSRI